MLAELPTSTTHVTDWIMVIAVFVGPIVAVSITLWWQQRKERRDAKTRLFTTLMAYRKSYLINYAWADSLNLIDVVFADCPGVVSRWHEYYAMLHQGTPPEHQHHKYLELLSAMSRECGFRNLQQTDIDKYYTPQGHANQADLDQRTQHAWLRVLETTAHLNVAPFPPDPFAPDAAPVREAETVKRKLPESPK